MKIRRSASAVHYKGEHLLNRDDFLIVREAADHLGVNEETVRRHLRSGRLRAEKLGQQWFVHRAELSAFSKIYDPRTGPSTRR